MTCSHRSGSRPCFILHYKNINVPEDYETYVYRIITELRIHFNDFNSYHLYRLI